MSVVYFCFLCVVLMTLEASLFSSMKAFAVGILNLKAIEGRGREGTWLNRTNTGDR